MRVVQIYLPVISTDTIVYNGFSQPILRYYERLIATHITPIIYKDISMSKWDKFKHGIGRVFKLAIKDLGYDRALFLIFASTLYIVAKKYGASWAKGIYEFIRQSYTKAKFPALSSNTFGLSESNLILEDRDDKRDKLFTEVVIDKDKIKLQFISLPITVNDVRKIFSAYKAGYNSKEVSKRMFSSLQTLTIYNNVDIKPLLLTIPCVVCSVEEIDEVKQRYSGETFNLIVIDSVNEIVYSKLVFFNKEFKYSTPLDDVIRKRKLTDLTLDRLSSVLQGIKVGGDI